MKLLSDTKLKGFTTLLPTALLGVGLCAVGASSVNAVTINLNSYALYQTNQQTNQQMDAQLNLAKRAVTKIEQGVNQLKKGDVAQYNRLSEQLTKAADHLKASTSQAHPEYVAIVQKWSTLRSQLVSLAEQWQSAPTQTARQQQDPNKPSTTASTSIAQANAENLDPDSILAKYQKQNRPQLPDYPNPSEVSEWAAKMKALQSNELQADLALLDASNASLADKQRVSNWIGGEFQNQIKQDIQNAMQRFNSLANTAVQLSQQIQGIDVSNKSRAYNFANGENGRNNAQTLERGLVASANAMALDEAFPKLANSQRQQQIGVIAMAQQKLEELSQVARVKEEELANAPKKQKPKKGPFLKGIAQELWYKGSVMASLDRKGSIWMNSQDVGDIESNGKIWVFSNSVGSLETDGKVWLNGNHIGTIEDNGKVWRGGNHIGTVVDGKVWIDGNENGEIVPYDGEWKRAAIVYYFRDIFVP